MSLSVTRPLTDQMRNAGSKQDGAKRTLPNRCVDKISLQIERFPELDPDFNRATLTTGLFEILVRAKGS